MKLFVNFRRWHLLIAFLRIRWKSVLTAFLGDFISNLCLVAMSMLIAQAVSVLFHFRSVRGSLLGLQGLEQHLLLTYFAALAVLKLGLDSFRLRLRGQLSEDFAHTLRIKAFGHHLRSDLRYHESRDNGHRLLRFGGDLGSAQQLLARGVLQFTADLGFLLLGTALVAYYSFLLAFAISAAVGAAVAVGYWLRLRLRVVESRRRNKKSGLLAFVSATLQHLPGIQALNRSTRTEQKFERKARQVCYSGHQYHVIAAWQSAITPFFAQMLLLSVLYFGATLTLTPTALFAVVLVLMTWRSPLSRLLRIGLVWEKGILSLDKFDRLLKTPVMTEGEQKLKKRGDHLLDIKNIDFSFGDKPVLQNFSLRITSGEKITVQLPTGGGKTTLVKILASLYQPDAGSIEWDGISMDRIASREIRRMVSFVSDTFPLTGLTLLDALSPSGQAEVLATTKVAFEQFQQRFPQLKDVNPLKKIGGRSFLGLSSGQQQLLQCLRAILADKPWLILDNPFAGLDSNTQQMLSEYIEENSINKGVLYLSTL
jgi:ABC-type bacteriocin/lantibiotic exporter with double-glycine peptidase domain